MEGDAEYTAELERRLEAERASPHLQRRLYPPRPGAEMPYVCFYPMSKRRAPQQNWYALSGEERSRLMWEHGKSGRRFAGRVFQVITGSIGFDAWEWGVTLFAGDPLEFKRVVTEMRFDEVSAQYAEFGDFWVGRLLTPEAWVAAVLESVGEASPDRAGRPAGRQARLLCVRGRVILRALRSGRVDGHAGSATVGRRRGTGRSAAR